MQEKNNKIECRRNWVNGDEIIVCCLPVMTCFLFNFFSILVHVHQSLTSFFQGPPFTYRYGFSFLLYVSGFITTEVAGTSAIFLYISWHQRDFGKRELSQKNCEVFIYLYVIFQFVYIILLYILYLVIYFITYIFIS